MSSGHSYGATDAGASQYLKINTKFIIINYYSKLEVKIAYFGSRPQTEPDILPPGPDSISDHFFHLEIDV